MDANPPPAAPVTPVDSEGPAPPPRKLAAGEGASWWGESWRIFCAAPGIWVGIVVIFTVISIALAFVPIIGSFVQTVLAPVFAGGLMRVIDDPDAVVEAIFEFYENRGFQPSRDEREKLLNL